MPHANIQYSQLPPEKRLWVIENCYKKLFTLVKENDYKIAFEASGKTVEEIAEKSPETMALLKELIANGNIEPVSSPYIHFMPANIPEELCVHSLVHALNTWEKFTGKRPTIGWNPECGWDTKADRKVLLIIITKPYPRRLQKSGHQNPYNGRRQLLSFV